MDSRIGGITHGEVLATDHQGHRSALPETHAPHASFTDPAGRAIKAAALQGSDVERRSLRRIRESIFLFGRGPETADEFVESFAGVPGFDQDRWLSDFTSSHVADLYRADWAEARTPNDYVRAYQSDEPMAGVMRHSEGHDRYDFPTVLFRGPTGEHTVPGWMPFASYVDALEAASPGATRMPRKDPSAEEAFAAFGVLTAKELEVLCGSTAKLPDDVITYNWGDGEAYFTRAEAASRHLV